MSPLLLTARWVFPIATRPIEDGAVLIADHRIVRVGRRVDVGAPAGVPRTDLGEAAILPGLVNCHAHLELSGVTAVAAEAFVPWLLEVRSRRQALPADAQARAAGEAARTLLASGVTCVGDVSTSGRSLGALQAAGLRGVVYREVVGVDPAQAAERAAAARRDVVRMTSEASPGLARGLSPHSPYALSEDLLLACRRLASELRLPVCTHVAESPEETTYLRTGGGEIPARLYPAVGVAAPPRREAATPLAYLDALGALVPGSLLVHAVHVEGEDVGRMRRHRLGVAHCPRSNARLSGGVAPIPAFLAHGIPVGLGTDSLASTPTLDLWDEMRAALDVHRLRPAIVLRMATQGGAQALGLTETGSLEAGKQADVIAMAVAHVRPAEPEASLLDSLHGADLLLALIGGEPRLARVAGVVPCA